MNLTFQANRTKRQFENIAFHRSVNRAVKQKIEQISNLSGMAGFTCFDWFLLDSSTGIHVGDSDLPLMDPFIIVDLIS